MPISPKWKTFSSGDDFDASAIKSRFRALELWLNGEIDTGDMRSDRSWVKPRHIFKPEFYGSPAPRVEAVSGDSHYRSRSSNIESRYYRHEQGGWYKRGKENEPVDGEEPTKSMSGEPYLTLQDDAIDDPSELFTPVEGLAVSFHLDEKSLVTVNANWSAWESGGSTGYDHQYQKNQAIDDPVAIFRLFYKSPDSDFPEATGHGATDRILYARSDSGYNFRRQNFSTTWMREFEAGNHHIYIGVLYVLTEIEDNDFIYLNFGTTNGTGHRVKHVYVDARNLVLNASRLYDSQNPVSGGSVEFPNDQDDSAAN